MLHYRGIERWLSSSPSSSHRSSLAPLLFHTLSCQPATLAHTHTDDWHTHTHTHSHRLACCSALAPVTREGGAWQCCKCVTLYHVVVYLLHANSCCVNLSVYFHCCSECCIVHYSFTVFEKSLLSCLTKTFI